MPPFTRPKSKVVIGRKSAAKPKAKKAPRWLGEHDAMLEEDSESQWFRAVDFRDSVFAQYATAEADTTPQPTSASNIGIDDNTVAVLASCESAVARLAAAWANWAAGQEARRAATNIAPTARAARPSTAASSSARAETTVAPLWQRAIQASSQSAASSSAQADTPVAEGTHASVEDSGEDSQSLEDSSWVSTLVDS